MGTMLWPPTIVSTAVLDGAHGEPSRLALLTFNSEVIDYAVLRTLMESLVNGKRGRRESSTLSGNRTNCMQNTKTPEQRVLESLFRKLADDPDFSKKTLNRLEKARDSGRLGDVKEILEACRLAGEANAADIPS